MTRDHGSLFDRGPGPHYRGMWSLDLILGREWS